MEWKRNLSSKGCQRRKAVATIPDVRAWMAWFVYSWNKYVLCTYNEAATGDEQSLCLHVTCVLVWGGEEGGRH